MAGQTTGDLIARDIYKKLNKKGFKETNNNMNIVRNASYSINYPDNIDSIIDIISYKLEK